MWNPLFMSMQEQELNNQSCPKKKGLMMILHVIT